MRKCRLQQPQSAPRLTGGGYRTAAVLAGLRQRQCARIEAPGSSAIRRSAPAHAPQSGAWAKRKHGSSLRHQPLRAGSADPVSANSASTQLISWARNRDKHPLRTEHPCLTQTCYGPARRPLGARRKSTWLVHKAEWPGNRVLALHLHGGNGNKRRSRRPRSMRECGDRSSRLDFGALPQATPKGIDTGG